MNRKLASAIMLAMVASLFSLVATPPGFSPTAPPIGAPGRVYYTVLLTAYGNLKITDLEVGAPPEYEHVSLDGLSGIVQYTSNIRTKTEVNITLQDLRKKTGVIRVVVSAPEGIEFNITDTGPTTDITHLAPGIWMITLDGVDTDDPIVLQLYAHQVAVGEHIIYVRFYTE